MGNLRQSELLLSDVAFNINVNPERATAGSRDETETAEEDAEEKKGSEY